MSRPSPLAVQALVGQHADHPADALDDVGLDAFRGFAQDQQFGFGRQGAGNGGASFDVLGAGQPESQACHLAYRRGLDVTADGQAPALGPTSGGLWISANGGGRWQCLSHDLPPLAAVTFMREWAE